MKNYTCRYRKNSIKTGAKGPSCWYHLSLPKNQLFYFKKILHYMQCKVKPQNITQAISVWVCWHLQTFSGVNIPIHLIFEAYCSPDRIIWERYERSYLLNFCVIIWFWKWSSLKIRSVIQKRSSNIHGKHEIMKPGAWSISIISSYTFIDSRDSPWLFFLRSLTILAALDWTLSHFLKNLLEMWA